MQDITPGNFSNVCTRIAEGHLFLPDVARLFDRVRIR